MVGFVPPPIFKFHFSFQIIKSMNFNFNPPAATAAPAPAPQPAQGLTAEQITYVNENGWTMVQSLGSDTGGSYRKGVAFATAMQFTNGWQGCPVTYAAFTAIINGLDKVKRGVMSYHQGEVVSVGDDGKAVLKCGTIVPKTKHQPATPPVEGAVLKFQTVSFGADTFDVVLGKQGVYFRYFSTEVKWHSYSNEMQNR